MAPSTPVATARLNSTRRDICLGIAALIRALVAVSIPLFMSWLSLLSRIRGLRDPSTSCHGIDLVAELLEQIAKRLLDGRPHRGGQIVPPAANGVGG